MSNEATRRPVCNFLLHGLELAGIRKALVIVRLGKWDIPETLLSTTSPRMALSYLFMSESPGVPWTIDFAYPFARKRTVAFGFPDILIRPATIHREMLMQLQATDSDVVLGLVPSTHTAKFDTVILDDANRVREIRPKCDAPEPGLVWCAAAWRSSFTEFLHEFMSSYSAGADSAHELYIGDVINASLPALKVTAYVASDGYCIDIGTPDDLASVRSLDG